MNKKSAILFSLLMAAMIVAWITWLSPLLKTQPKPKDAASAKAATLVTVVTAHRKDLPIKLSTQGHLVPLNQVEVRPQLSGLIGAVHFREGDEVKAGQLLFTVDSADADAQLARAQALAAQVKAQMDDADRDVMRAQRLARTRYLSSSAVDTSLSKLESLKAQHHAALADIANARTALARTRILAPITGRTGALGVHPGSLAQLGGTVTPLVTVVQVDPIGVEFTLPESSLSEVLAAKAKGAVTVTLTTADGQAQPGSLVFIDNTVMTDTATITMKASFPNAARTLWPGGFARVTVDAGMRSGAIVVPPQAVLEGPNGRFVYVVNAGQIATVVPVNLLRIQDGQAVIEGLRGGELIVAEGGTNVKPGAKVRWAGQAKATEAVR